MKKIALSLIVRSIAAILPLTLAAASAPAQGVTVLTDFGRSRTDGYLPASPLVFDHAGNLYGTTSYGGPANLGTVFELTKKPDGVWARKTLYSFPGGADGALPSGALVLDAAANLYGTTQYTSGVYNGNGTVFELSPRSDGSWKETVLYNFAGSSDGGLPQGGVIFDSAGNLYGTTSYGGAHETNTVNGGTIFELTPQEGGGWKKSILYSFANAGPSFVSGLTLDKDGNLYGTMVANLQYAGVVFKLSSGSGGAWSYTTLHTFPGDSADGFAAFSGVVLDADGNLYGATLYGPGNSQGTVFEVPAGQGPNGPDKILYTFYSGGTRGRSPVGGLVFDASGNLYGTTAGGGFYGGGKIFEMLPNRGGTWTVKDLHDFGGQKYNGFTGIDGKAPAASMIFGADGNLYGTTEDGGYLHDAGVVFRLDPY
jgi:uncharacterized repeat protein (TIGR03803 family)